MHSSCSLVAALVIACTVIAAPLNEIKERNAQFSVQQTLNPAFKGFQATGQAALAKAYAKYAKHGAVMPDDVSKAVSAAAAQYSGTIPANPTKYDTEYLCPVSIGSPAQKLNLDFDTGSADLWVFSSQTPGSEVHGQKLYNPFKSSTANLLSGQTWAIAYGDGSSASGDVYDDVVNVGGVSFPNQAVESAEQVSDSFTNDTALSGLLGLSFSSLNSVTPTPQNTFFTNVQSSLASPVFTVSLKHKTAGTYDFGFIDTAKYTGLITYTPVDNPSGLWEFTGSGYAIGSGSFVSTSIDAIADTGTTLLLVSDTIVSDYYANVEGAQYSSSQVGYVFPCTATLPSFTFGIGSYRGTIPGEYINYAPVNKSSCYGGIQSNDGFGVSIYGDILLKTQFVVFDGGQNQVGFAAQTLS